MIALSTEFDKLTDKEEIDDDNLDAFVINDKDGKNISNISR